VTDQWATTALSDVVSLKRGHDLPKTIRRAGTVPVIGSGESWGWHDESIANGPGVVLGRATNLGVPQWIDRPYWPLNTTLYVTDFKSNDPRFVFHLFEVLDLAGFNSGSVQPMLNRNYIAKVPVALPPFDEQRRIAEVLGALDDLIDTNEQLMSGLRTASEALFDRCQNESTEQFALDEVIELKYGRALPTVTRRSGAVPVVSSAGITGRHDTALVAGPGVVVGRKGSVGSVTWVDADFFPIDTAFYVEANRVPMSWAYFLLKSLPLASMNTDSAVPGLNRANALALRVAVPDVDALRNFDMRASELLEGVRELQAENQQLRRTRDELLPLLMSGTIRVRPEGVAA